MGSICNKKRQSEKDYNKEVNIADYMELADKAKVEYLKLHTYTIKFSCDLLSSFNIILERIKIILSNIVIFVSNLINNSSKILKEEFYELEEFVDSLNKMFDEDKLELINSDDDYKNLINEHKILIDKLNDLLYPKQIIIDDD